MIRAALILLVLSASCASAQENSHPPGVRWNGQRWDGRDRPIDGGSSGGGSLPSNDTVHYDPIINYKDRQRGRTFPVHPGNDPALARALRDYENRP